MKPQEFEELLRLFNQFKYESQDEEFGFEDDWVLFLKKMLLLSPKSYGTKIQNRIIKRNNFNKVSQTEDKGDFEINNEFFEIKTSIITITNKTANISGIRKHQEINGYYIILINAIDYSNPQTYVYRLSNTQMCEEMKKKNMNASPLNGTKQANKDNKKIPYRIGLSIKSDNKHFIRWNENYKYIGLKL